MDSASISDRKRRTLRILVTMFCIVSTSGCARAVLPSEKAYLADPIMQFDPDTLESTADAHFYMNREGAAGATGTRGGGCGCN